MKSERRHDLQTNYLANQLGSAVETSKPAAVWIVGGIIGVAIAALGYGIYGSWSQQASSAAWGEFYFKQGTGDAESLQDVISDHPNSQAAAWATQAIADGLLASGLELIYIDREKGLEKINSAIKQYESLINTYDLELKFRATMGLAQAYEATGKLDEASKYYQQVATNNVLPAVAATAAERLAWLKSGEAKEFYTWFASPKKPADPAPNIPKDLGTVPTQPDINFPPVNGAATGTIPPLPEVDPKSVPLPGSDAPAGSTPAGSTPAETPSVPAATPADLPKAPAESAATAPAATPEPPSAPPAEAPPK